MTLQVTYDSATDIQLDAGLEAAFAVFQAAGVDPRTAATAHFVFEGYDINGYLARAHVRRLTGLADPPDDRGPSEDVSRLAALWDDAWEAAHREVKRALGAEPTGPGLELADM